MSKRPLIPTRRTQVVKSTPKPSQEISKLIQEGLALHRAGRINEAKLIYEEIYKKDVNNFDVLQLLGAANAQVKNWEIALQYLNQALHINKANSAVFNNRGNVLKELKQLDEALKSYDQALHIKPDYAEAFNNRGIVLKELKQFDEALKSYDQALRIKPDYAEAFNNRGIVLQELKQFDEALKSYDQALRIKPDYAEAFINRGNVLQELKQFDEALKSYDQALRIKPDYAEAFYNRGLLRLRLRDFHPGFADYRRRFQIKDFKSKPLKTTLPSCEDVGLSGRILLWAEQGIGDEIFYAGLLSMLNKSTSVTVSADKRLHSIYKRSFPTINLLDKDILSKSTLTSGFDAQAPLGDLGYCLGVDYETIKETRTPYLKSCSLRRDDFSKRISELGSGLVCGIAWKSDNKEFGPDKSVDLSLFEPILCLPGFQFVNLQYGNVKNDIEKVNSKYSVNIHQIPNLDVFQDLDGLLALIDACDVVVTTSNITAHLTGGLGKQSAVLIPFGGNARMWYWHHNDENSFWYSSLRLFHQDNPLDWGSSIKDCADWMMQLYG